jgi:hypothetical protein
MTRGDRTALLSHDHDGRGGTVKGSVVGRQKMCGTDRTQAFSFRHTGSGPATKARLVNPIR